MRCSAFIAGVLVSRWSMAEPRLLGMSHALDLILTGRGVLGDEALTMGLANRLVEPGKALEAAKELVRQLAAFPQRCMRSDRSSAYEAGTLPLAEALVNEYRHGIATIQSGETHAGAERFKSGAAGTANPSIKRQSNSLTLPGLPSCGRKSMIFQGFCWRKIRGTTVVYRHHRRSGHRPAD